MSKRVTRENSRKDTPRSDLARAWTGRRASRVRVDYQAYAPAAATLSPSSRPLRTRGFFGMIFQNVQKCLSRNVNREISTRELGGRDISKLSRSNGRRLENFSLPLGNAEVWCLDVGKLKKLETSNVTIGWIWRNSSENWNCVRRCIAERCYKADGSRKDKPKTLHKICSEEGHGTLGACALKCDIIRRMIR